MKNSKKILIPQRYAESGLVQRGIVDTLLSDFLIDQGFLPVVAAFHTKTNSFEEIESLVASYLDLANAVILQGGSDTCPSFYGQDNYFARGITRFRDFFELEIIRQAVARKIPILGICRGMQLLNVYFGGTLHQDLEVGKWQKHSFASLSSDYENHGIIANQKFHHTVNLVQNGFLHQSLGQDKIWVNSFHHQGIDQLAKNLVIEAQSSDGLIEAFSDLENKILAVQWHPELDPNQKNYNLIFQTWLKYLD